MGITEKH